MIQLILSWLLSLSLLWSFCVVLYKIKVDEKKEEKKKLPRATNQPLAA